MLLALHVGLLFATLSSEAVSHYSGALPGGIVGLTGLKRDTS
jgi:hypothetical protein